MIKFLEGTQDRHIGVQVSGRIGKEDFSALTSLLEESMARHGRIRLLIVLEDLPLMDPATFWEDVKFSVKHLRDVERVALVGDARWQEPYTRIVGAVVPAKARHFGSDEIEAAWEWLRGD